MILPAPEAFDLPFSAWRPAQTAAILQAFDSTRRVVGLQLPTGVGKSGVAVAVAQLLDRPAVILTSTKALQDQYRETFAQVCDIRGMGNYACLEAVQGFAHLFLGRRHVGCDEGPCRVGMTCDQKESGCSFFDAMRTAKDAPILVTSYANWIADLRFRKGMLGERPVVILDEAHDAPAQLADNLHVKLAPWDLALPKHADVRTHSEWRNWALREAVTRQAEIKQLRDVKKKLRLRRLVDTLTTVAHMGDDWVVWRTAKGVEFAPTAVAAYAERYLFGEAGTAGTVVLLSATATPRVAEMLGVRSAARTWYSAPSPFPVARRPIYTFQDTPKIRIDHRTSPEMIDWWVHRMDEWISRRKDRKGIIHTVSYARQQLIVSKSAYRGRMIAPTKAKDVPYAVEQLRTARRGAILISPSVMTGFDFPYEDCEWQILSKVPFPDTRSAIVKARVKDDPLYGPHTTMQLLVQAAGRGMRAVDDRCETLIVDDHIHWFLGRYGDLAPDWFLEAVQPVTRMPAPASRLAP
jgi:ATP-dependent DNA helicase DinG